MQGGSRSPVARLSHPNANSVYMGRENGSFVRSHPRAWPAQYDPRQRPWYELGISNPAEVMRTEPYRSVTTPNINIGTVKALVDEQGQVDGVVGIDVTLRNLTDYISDVGVGEGSYVVLMDENGIVLTGQDEESRFQRFDEAGLDYFQQVMDNDRGRTSFEQGGRKYYLYYFTSPELGWKIGAVVPVWAANAQRLGPKTGLLPGPRIIRCGGLFDPAGLVPAGLGPVAEDE
ncbi:MAG: cache domain-containing protein, partial [Anaerolineae bacterium]